MKDFVEHSVASVTHSARSVDVSAASVTHSTRSVDVSAASVTHSARSVDVSARSVRHSACSVGRKFCFLNHPVLRTPLRGRGILDAMVFV